MISRQEWDQLSEEKKFDYLFRCSVAAEKTLQVFGTTLEAIRDRLAKLEEKNPHNE
jgi:hypothetical protein